MRNTVLACLAAALPALALPTIAEAYVGPGAGLGAIAVTVAVILGVVLLVVGFLWYPLKRMLSGNKGAEKSAPPQAED